MRSSLFRASHTRTYPILAGVVRMRLAHSSTPTLPSRFRQPSAMPWVGPGEALGHSKRHWKDKRDISTLASGPSGTSTGWGGTSSSARQQLGDGFGFYFARRNSAGPRFNSDCDSVHLDPHFDSHKSSPDSERCTG